MDVLTSQIVNWLTELEENDAADFFSKCSIETIYVDTSYDIYGGDKETQICDVTVFVPIKLYKNLHQYSHLTSKIEEAIRETGESSSVYFKQIDWKARFKSESDLQNEKRREEILGLLSQDYVSKQLVLMNQSIQSAPHLSLGIAKELIETCCKTILRSEAVFFDKDWDILKLVKETNKVLDLVPFDVINHESAKSSVAKILGGLSTIVHGITELRNEYGTGHGHDADFKMLDNLYVKLAVTSASELAIFYLTLQKLKQAKSGD